MRITTGTVVSGKIVLNDSAIADGTDVFVLTTGGDPSPVLSLEERSDLQAGIAEADAGDMLSGKEFFDRLRSQEIS